MKPQYQLVPGKEKYSFLTDTVTRTNFLELSEAWHYHPEIEICLSLKGTGKRFVGNDISIFKKNDLVMFGSNLPHGYMSQKKLEQVVIFFDHQLFGTYFFNRPELEKVRLLFARASNGIKFGKKTTEKARVHIEKILSSYGLEKMIHFLGLLDLLSEANDSRLICSQGYQFDPKSTNRKRIMIIYKFIMENYHRDVNIKEVAEKVNLSEASFYKFIKKHTRKTYTQMINEFRINHASKLLIISDKNILEICYESGYNNVSHFNRMFKNLTGKTPREFKSEYAKDS